MDARDDSSAPPEQRPLGTESPDIFAGALKVGRARLLNTPRLMAMNGLIGGLYVTFSGLGYAVALASLGFLPEGAARLLAALFYPVGFIFVLLGKSELFTENFLTPVLAAWRHHMRPSRLALLWGVTLAANLLGVLLAAWVWAWPALGLLPEGAREVLAEIAREDLARPLLSTFAKAVVAGVLITFMTWLVIAAQDPVARLAMMFVPTYLIVMLGAAHSVVGSFEVLVGVFSGEGTLLGWATRFLVPVVLGNMAGGVVFVSALHYAQAREERRTREERRRREDRIRRRTGEGG